MSKEDDLKGKKPKKPAALPEAEVALWKEVVKDVRKLDVPEIQTPKTGLPRSRLKGRPGEPSLPGIVPKALGPNSGMIDRKTEDRVRKGLMTIEASLDLHGQSVNNARNILLRFVLQSAASGRRCVLVVTGKGRTGQETGIGAIKREFRLWLEDSSVKPYIMSVAQARPKHGGEGAFYIYLRKLS